MPGLRQFTFKFRLTMDTLCSLLQSSLNQRRKKGSISFGSTEKKLLVVFIYYEFLAVIALLIFTLNVIFSDVVVRSIRDYFLCEQRGHDPENPCSRYEINRYGIPWVTATSNIIIAAYPIVNLIYAVNIKRVKQLCSGKKTKTTKTAVLQKISSSQQRNEESVPTSESNF